jgi:hypothetical protein
MSEPACINVSPSFDSTVVKASAWFDDAYDERKDANVLASQDWFGKAMAKAWPELRGVLCYVTMVKSTKLGGKSKFFAKPGLLEVDATLDARPLAALDPRARADYVYKFALLMAAAALRQKSKDASAIERAIAERYGHVDLGATSTQASAVPVRATRASARAAEIDVEALLPFTPLYRGRGVSRDFAFLWIESDRRAARIVRLRGKIGVAATPVSEAFASASAAKKALRDELRRTLDDGYRPLGDDDWRTLVAECAVEGFGTAADLDERHVLEDAVDTVLRERGLGWCDGGSIGSGTMEIACFVENYARARHALAEWFAAHYPARRFRLRNEG